MPVRRLGRQPPRRRQRCHHLTITATHFSGSLRLRSATLRIQVPDFDLPLRVPRMILFPHVSQMANPRTRLLQPGAVSSPQLGEMWLCIVPQIKIPVQRSAMGPARFGMGCSRRRQGMATWCSADALRRPCPRPCIIPAGSGCVLARRGIKGIEKAFAIMQASACTVAARKVLRVQLIGCDAQRCGSGVFFPSLLYCVVCSIHPRVDVLCVWRLSRSLSPGSPCVPLGAADS